jgi:hypothetical protein
MRYLFEFLDASEQIVLVDVAFVLISFAFECFYLLLQILIILLFDFCHFDEDEVDAVGEGLVVVLVHLATLVHEFLEDALVVLLLGRFSLFLELHQLLHQLLQSLVLLLDLVL